MQTRYLCLFGIASFLIGMIVASHLSHETGESNLSLKEMSPRQVAALEQR